MGCGSSTDEAPPAPPEPIDAKWPMLISADWSVPGGQEGYVCARVTVQEDLFVAGFASSTTARGAHHALLTIGVPDAPDGVGPCNYDSGFGVTAFGESTTLLQFPPGIATKIPKGAQLLLNVHIS